MTTVISQRAEPAAEVASPLIQMCGVEKVCRTGQLEFTALWGVDVVMRPPGHYFRCLDGSITVNTTT